MMSSLANKIKSMVDGGVLSWLHRRGWSSSSPWPLEVSWSYICTDPSFGNTFDSRSNFFFVNLRKQSWAFQDQIEKERTIAFLDKNGSIEFADSNTRPDSLPWCRQQNIQDLVVGLPGEYFLLDIILFNILPFPDVLHRLPQVLVRLVQPALHLDVQRRADEGEEGRLELDGAVVVERHVHRDQPLASNPRGAEPAESEGWVDLPEQGEVEL